jgi:Rab3 GTPase-activating protein non-catalytic subunit
MSPNKALSVVCDSLGRVVLLDNASGVQLRMWKGNCKFKIWNFAFLKLWIAGNRDAQCGWIEVRDPSSKSSTSRSSSKSRLRIRTALFLVLYSPKKGMIEIWAMQNGPKVASFVVPKDGKLIYTNYGHVGVNNVPVKGSSRSLFPCVFINPDGTICEISVPFHFALRSVGFFC